jgi:hypothetical protein
MLSINFFKYANAPLLGIVSNGEAIMRAESVMAKPIRTVPKSIPNTLLIMNISGCEYAPTIFDQIIT